MDLANVGELSGMFFGIWAAMFTAKNLIHKFLVAVEKVT